MRERPKFRVAPDGEGFQIFAWRRRNGGWLWVPLFLNPISPEAADAKVRGLRSSGLFEVIDERPARVGQQADGTFIATKG